MLTHASALFFAALLVFMTVQAAICVWSHKKPFVISMSIGLFAITVALGFGAFIELMSRPKPLELEFVRNQTREATVLWSRADEGEGIYLLLQFDGSPEPRLYAAPWSMKLAQDLQGARNEREADIRIRMPFEPGWDVKPPEIYPRPQPLPPLKDERLVRPPMVFPRHPQRAI